MRLYRYTRFYHDAFAFHPWFFIEEREMKSSRPRSLGPERRGPRSLPPARGQNAGNQECGKIVIASF